MIYKTNNTTCAKCKKKTTDYRVEYIRPEIIGTQVAAFNVGNQCCPLREKKNRTYNERTDISKVVFLDIDGVVNSEESLRRTGGGAANIDQFMAFLIGKIQLETDCIFVLSSAWRHYPKGIAEIEKHIVKIHDVTPSMPLQGGAEMCERGFEIKAWLDKHPEVLKYAILDDSSDMLPEQLSNFFKTSWKTGITEEIMNDVIKHLS